MRARFQDMPDTAQQPLKYGESVKIGDVEVSLVPAGHILGSAQVGARASRASASSSPATTSAGPTRPARPSSRCRATSSSPRRPSPCRCSVTRPTPARSAAAALARDFPERAHLVGVYALGKCQRVITLLREAGYDKRIWIHGALASLCKLYEEHGVALGELALVVGRDPRRPSRAPSCSARPRRSPTAGRAASPIRSPSMASGWMRRARARPPARRRAAAGHLRPCRLGRADARPLEGCRRAQGLGDARPRGRAGRTMRSSSGIDAEALHLAGREEEDES